MKRLSVHLLPYFCLLVTGWSQVALAQDVSSEKCLQVQFEQALELLDSFKNDNANVVLLQLMDELKQRNRLDSPFGLKVQLRQAEVLEKDFQDEAAIQRLLTIADASQQQEQWAVFVNAQLSLARLHEKLDRPKDCYQDLLRAKTVIHDRHLDSIYPRMSIRLASYHRLFGDRDSALFYASEVLRTAPLFDQHSHQGTGHMLMGLLSTTVAFDEARSHFVNGAHIFKKQGNFSGYAYMLSNISRLHLKKNQLDKALIYNDSFLIASHRAIEDGNEELQLLASYYMDRAEIYRRLERHDSAFHYLKLGHEVDLEKVLASNEDKVLEIESRYNDAKKAQKIEEQEQLLRYERAQRNWILGLTVLVVLFSGILTRYYLKLRTANRKTKKQATTINKKNTQLSEALRQQIMLQGEMHHRVKNNLQVIISLLELQSDEIEDPKALASLNAMSNRIHSIAAIHDILHHKRGQGMISFRQYAHNLCAHFRNFANGQHSPVFDLSIGRQRFNLATLMPLGIILNELLTNSLKYATQANQQLIITITLLRQGDRFCLRYQDNGPGFPQNQLQEREGGLGTYLLKSMSRQLGGHLDSKNEGGAVCSIFFREKTQNELYESFAHADR